MGVPLTGNYPLGTHPGKEAGRPGPKHDQSRWPVGKGRE